SGSASSRWTPSSKPWTVPVGRWGTRAMKPRRPPSAAPTRCVNGGSGPAVPGASPDGILALLRSAGRLRAPDRSGSTSAGRHDSTAEHTWRLCLMALLLAPEFPEVDCAHLIRMCLVHDLGEALSGDVPAPEQARRLAEDPSDTKA